MNDDTTSDDQIVNFCELTGATPEQAQTFIQLSDGNVEAAIGLFLESGGANAEDWTRQAQGQEPAQPGRQPSVQSSNNHNQSEQQQVVDFMSEDDEDYDEPYRSQATGTAASQTAGIRDPIASRQDRLFGDDEDLMVHGFGPGMTAMHTRFGQNVMQSRLPDPFGRRGPAMPGSDPVSVEDEAANRLARLFAPPRELMFHGDFYAARAYAKSDGRWLIVTLHDPTEFPCQVLNRDLWKDGSIVEIVKAMFVFQQFVVDTPEGQRYRNFYPVESLPHIAIIDPRTGERVREWHVVPAATEFLVDLMDFTETHSLENAKRSGAAKKHKASIDLTEDEQIAAAIEASIQSTSTSSVSAQPSASVNETSAPSQPEAVSTLIAPAERSEIPAGTDGTTSIQFRLPDGKRVVRKFLKSDTVRRLFEHIKFAVPDLQAKPFELVFHRDNLSKSLDNTLQELKLTAAAINVDYL